MRVWLIATLLLLPSPASAEDYPRDRLSVMTFASEMVFVGLSATDKIVTYKAVTQNRAREVGPLLAPWVETHGVKSAMIGGLALDLGQAAGMAYIAKRWPGSRKAVLGGFIAATAVKGFVIAHNARVLHSR